MSKQKDDKTGQDERSTVFASQSDDTQKDGPQQEPPKGQDDIDKTQPNDSTEPEGLDEGVVRTARDESGLNGLPGHESNVTAWENSVEGKRFLKDAEDTKKAEENAKEAHSGLDEDGKSESVKKYEETVEG